MDDLSNKTYIKTTLTSNMKMICALMVAILLLSHVVHARDASSVETVDEVKNIIVVADSLPEVPPTTVIPSVATLTSGDETEDVTVEVVPSLESYKTLKRDKRMLFGLHWAFKAPFLIAHHFVKKIVGFGSGFIQGIKGPGIFG